ncbi:50S ribosomal protein L36e [Thecamonas trahens ATCC 50062]|uniref:50S ribosomal protein L36e n=1 Tax=Thecamonas trahens ATCC 50062 TaxID=461836 RepID=A0A0L0DRB6_THETB|nr:50S ribosomal protein L36e [Thecamonas trahens ATCC 50062]KNC54792.1 50S ribosomal protein L36e [Thecamonas trahens ATCC 50062]|eukprot:XP_013761692.1 50S ribosomal protein L36e [Thecamonas trahens ATCC 50062]
MVKNIAVGLKRGYPVQKIKPMKTSKDRKGVLGKRTKFVREVIREVSGFAAYERRIMELLRVGHDKRALKFAKKRLGTHTRALRKRDEMGAALRAMQQANRARAQEEAAAAKAAN